MTGYKKIVPKLLIGIASLALAVPINAWIFQILVSPNVAEIVFENKSDLLIDSIDVKLCGDGKQIKLIEPGKTGSAKFDIAGDCHYTINVSFNGGTSLSSETGYLTSGSNFKDVIVIEKDRMVSDKPIMESDPNYLVKTIGLFLSYIILSILIYRSLFFLLKKAKRPN